MEKQRKLESERHEITSTVDLSELINSRHQPNPLQEIEPFEEVWVVDHFLSPQESSQITENTDSVGFGKTHYSPFYRGNFRLIIDSPPLAEQLWPRVQALLGPNFTVQFKNQTWRPTGLNPRFRFSKYHPGHKFERHVDDCYIKSPTHQSMLTVNIYLNDNPAATRMYHYSKKHKAQFVDVVPQAGKALIFRQAPHADLLHAGLKVTEGLKYLMRTDVMFQQN